MHTVEQLLDPLNPPARGARVGQDQETAREVQLPRGHAGGRERKSEPLLALAKRLGRAALFGDVAHEDRELDPVAGGVVERADHDVGEKQGAVLARPPVLPFETSFVARLLDLPFRVVRADALGSQEHGHRLADDFGGGIAHEPLGSGIPLRHPPVGTE